MKTTLKLFFLAAALLLSEIVGATAQAPDIIRINGKEHALNTNPLSAQLEGMNWQPPTNFVTSTGNWRGHVATWEVRKKQLLLTDVTILVTGADSGEFVKQSILAELFPSSPSEVPATWYSGALVVPLGRMTNYVHMGYGSSYERYLVIRVNDGQVVEQLELSESEFGEYAERKFEEFSGTEEFRKSLESMRKEAGGMTEEQMIDFMRSFYAERYLSR